MDDDDPGVFILNPKTAAMVFAYLSMMKPKEVPFLDYLREKAEEARRESEGSEG